MAEQHALRETAWAATLYAAAALEERTPDAHAATAIAKAHGAHAAKAVVEGALQVFGGVGFTREHDLTDVLTRYSTSIDEFDYSGIRSTLADDVEAQYANLPPVTGGDALVAWIKEATATAIWQFQTCSGSRSTATSRGRCRT